MSVFFATISEGNVVNSTKQVNSNVIQVVDGVEQLFTDLSDHISISGLDACQVGDLYNAEDGSFTSPGTDAQGQSRWYDMNSGVLMENTYDADSGVVNGSQAV